MNLASAVEPGQMYQVASPAQGLQAYIDNYWAVFPDEEGSTVDLCVEVFADARADLIFNFGCAYLRQQPGHPTRKQQISNLDAQRDYPIRIYQKGKVQIIGVRWRAGGLGAFIGDSLHRLSNQVWPLADIFGKAAQPLEDDLRSQPQDFSTILDSFWLKRRQLSKSFEQFCQIKDSLEACHGTTPVEALCQQYHLSIRTVDRLFRRFLGFSPKRYAAIIRFQKVLTHLMESPSPSLAQIAADCRYSDQSHLVRDFHRFAGSVPNGYKGYYPPASRRDFAPNLVQFVQDSPAPTH